MIVDNSSDRDVHAEEDENYFISMTDMMVGVLFIFIILLMVFAHNYREQTDTSEDQIQRLRQAAEAARTVAAELEGVQKNVRSEIDAISEADKVRTSLLEDIQSKLKEQGLIVTIDTVSGVVRLGTNAINFPVDSPILDGSAAANVAVLAKVLADVLPSYAFGGTDKAAYLETVFIEGHTDRTGIDEANWLLSTARAVNTYRSLTATQPVLRSLTNSKNTEIMSVSGYSSTRPIPSIDLGNFQAQRRIDLRFVMDGNNMDRLKDVLELTGVMQDKLRFLRQAVEDANVP